MPNWPAYINATKNKQPRQLLTQASKYLINKGAALDLGAGALNESKYILGLGFKEVVAIDKEENLGLINKINNSAFIFKKIKIEDYIFPTNYFNLVNAQFVLPFIAREKIGKVMENIKNSLTSGGLFVGQFFGAKDSWKNSPSVCVYTEREIRDLLLGLDIVYFQEEEKDGPTALGGEKHWDIFHFIAKKY